MWNFLNPIALFGLIAAGIPLILHLLSRRRVKIIPFSSTEFLNRMKQSRMRYVRLKEILLLIIRTLIIAFIVLGFSRPVYRGASGHGEGSSSTAILIDDSYSMSRQTHSGTLFEIAKSRALEFLDHMNPGDEVAVIAFLSPDPSYFEKLLSGGCRITPDTTDITAPITSAIRILNQAQNLNRELVIISDFNLCGWSNSEPILNLLSDFDGRIVFLNIRPDESNNAYLTGIDYGGRIIQPGVGFDIQVAAQNGTGRRLDRLLIDLTLDSKRISQSEFSLEPSESTGIGMRAIAASAGFHRGRVEISEDELAADNRHYFTFKIPEKIKLLIVGSDEWLKNKIRLAASPPGFPDNHITTSLSTESKVISMGMSDYDAVIFSDYTPNPALAARISSFVDASKGVFIIPQKGADIHRLNNDLKRLSFPASIQREIDPGAGGYFSLEKIDTGHPFFSVYHNVKELNQQFKLPEVKFSSYFKTALTGRVRVPASIAGGEPLFIVSAASNGIVVFSASPLSEDNSDITSSSLFLPLIQRTTEFMASGASRFGRGYKIGQTVRLTPDRNIAPGNLIIESPDGRSFRVNPDTDRSGEMITFAETAVPGIYLLKSGESIIDGFAVNVDTRESRPGMVDRTVFEKALPPDNFAFIDQDRSLTETITTLRVGREFTIYAFSIVLALLLIEMLLAGKRPGSPSIGQEDSSLQKEAYRS
jgi:hypothetical protein